MHSLQPPALFGESSLSAIFPLLGLFQLSQNTNLNATRDEKLKRMSLVYPRCPRSSVSIPMGFTIHGRLAPELRVLVVRRSGGVVRKPREVPENRRGFIENPLPYGVY